MLWYIDIGWLLGAQQTTLSLHSLTLQDKVLWFYSGGRLNSTTTTLSFPFLNEDQGENMMKSAQGLR